MRKSLAAVVLAMGAAVALAGPASADDKDSETVPSYTVVVGPVELSTPYVESRDEKDSFEESLATCIEDDVSVTDGDCDPKT